MDFKSNTVKTTEMSITPELAQEMLKTSVGNRAIRKWHVDVLAVAQQRGEWTLTHQGAAFDSNGVLRDAHHRLMACVRSGVTIRMLVTVGLSRYSSGGELPLEYEGEISTVSDYDLLKVKSKDDKKTLARYVLVACCYI